MSDHGNAPASALATFEEIGLSPLASLLRCLDCAAPLQVKSPRELVCSGCLRPYPVDRGTVRMVARGTAAEQVVKEQTARSFAYEWERFGAPRSQWRRNFLDYVRPHDAESLRGKVILDVGTGSGRHSREAAALGANVVAIDLGDSIDVARANLPPEVLTVQADAEALPFASGTFDLVMSIGVLHHVPDTERAFRGLVPLVREGGHLHVYLYWQPEVRWHRALLGLVTTARRITTRLPHRLLHVLCYPLAAVLLVTFVAPFRALRHRQRWRRLALALPLQTYAEYPFGVLVNDQFDRFSAPLERRFTRAEVEALFVDAGLEDVHVLPNAGWVGDGRRKA